MSFSARLNFEYGVPQGSTLGLLRFNINMTVLFYECEENDIVIMLTTKLPILALLTFSLSFLN